eukprot:4561800-Karenia_brevis.AAC.1
MEKPRIDARITGLNASLHLDSKHGRKRPLEAPDEKWAQYWSKGAVQRGLLGGGRISRFFLFPSSWRCL